jgi:hypothetical protein
MRTAVLWQHVFQLAVCVLGAVQLHGTQYTYHKLKYMLPQHCIIYNDFSQAQPKLPEDGPNGPKHVGANIRYFNVNFNILYV